MKDLNITMFDDQDEYDAYVSSLEKEKLTPTLIKNKVVTTLENIERKEKGFRRKTRRTRDTDDAIFLNCVYQNILKTILEGESDNITFTVDYKDALFPKSGFVDRDSDENSYADWLERTLTEQDLFTNLIFCVITDKKSENIVYKIEWSVKEFDN